jgi:hypothetical protein
MNQETYRYSFNDGVPLKEVEESLLLAVLATECLQGRARVKMEASFQLDKEKRACVIDAGTEVGSNIARIFTGFLTREFGEEAFKINRDSILLSPAGHCGNRGR